MNISLAICAKESILTVCSVIVRYMHWEMNAAGILHIQSKGSRIALLADYRTARVAISIFCQSLMRFRPWRRKRNKMPSRQEGTNERNQRTEHYGCGETSVY